MTKLTKLVRNRLLPAVVAAVCLAIGIAAVVTDEETTEDGSGADPKSLPNYTNEVDGKQNTTLVLEPLDDFYFNKNRIQVHFKYRVRGRNYPDGSAEVRLRNSETGEVVKKKFSVSYTMGEHFEWAAWGGEGKGSSSKDSLLDDMLLGELAQDDELPDGEYIPGVTLFAADGSVIADLEYTPGEVEHMRNTGTLAGKSALKLSRKTINGKISEMRKMYDAILSAEEEAKAAGADVTVPHFMALAIKETLRQAPDRANALQYHLILENYRYCAEEAPKALAQLAQYRDDPSSAITAPPTPRPVNQRMTIKDGYFWAGDEPVFMSGMCMFALWMDFETVREFGYNLVHLGLTPGSIYPDSEEPTGKPRMADYNDPSKDGLVDVLDTCERLGIKVDVGVCMNPLPEWFYEKYPAARLNGFTVAGMVPYDIENPDVQRFLSDYYKEVMKAIGGHPAINSIWLANEPTYYNLGEPSTALFQEEMSVKYGGLEGINKAWGMSLTNMVEVRPWGSLNEKGNTDFWWFNLGRLTKHFQWMSDEIHKHDPEVPTCFKLNNLIMGWYSPIQNVDQEAVSDIGKIIGCDSGAYPFAIPYYDWLKSLDPDRPVVNLEFKSGGIRAGLDLWKVALHGHAGVDFWCWHGNPKFSTAMTHTSNLHRQALETYNIQRLIRQVMAFQKFPRSPYVVLYPDPVLPRVWEYRDAQTPVVNALKFSGHAVDYVTEKRLREGRLEKYDYDFIVMPSCNYISDDTFNRVGEYVKGGGRAIVVGELPEKGPMWETRDLDWLKTPEKTDPLYAGATNGLSFACGKGRVWIMPKSDEKTLQRDLEAISEGIVPVRPVVMEDVEYRSIPWTNDKGEKVYLTYVINEWTGADMPMKPLKFNVEMESAFDLISNNKVDIDKPLVLPKATALMIEWKPKR